MQTGKALILICLCMPALSSVCAHEISIESSKGVYGPGDMITISALVLNSGLATLNLTIELLVEDLSGRVAASPLSFAVTAQPGREVNLTLMETTVDDSYYNGLYRVSARLVDGRFVADQDELFFQVQGAPEDLSLRVLLCADPECEEESLVFIRNERVYIRYVSSVEDVSVAASISDPVGLNSEVAIPFDFTANTVGAYALILTASKSGYRDLTIVKGFAVIEEEPDIAASAKKPSALYLEAGPSKIAGDTAMALEGRVEPIHAEASVTLICRKDDGRGLNMSVVTDDDGRFWTRFHPEPTFTELFYALLGRGTRWEVQATWDGDSNHLGSHSEIRDLIVKYEVPLEFLILGLVVILVIIGIAVGLARRRR